MEKYLSVRGDCVTEKTLEKSVFITSSRHVESEEEARAFIAEVCAKYSDATHNCYAFIPDMFGNSPRFSDDNEPQGTAGMPILEVIKNRGLTQIAVVVTRYFGGIKLGAGGLVRAYSGCAAENLASAREVIYTMCTELSVTVDYSLSDAAARYFASGGVQLISTEYLNEVIYTIIVKKTDREEIVAALNNKLNGKAQIKDRGEYFYPFDTRI